MGNQFLLKIKCWSVVVCLVLSSITGFCDTTERGGLPPNPSWFYYFTILGKDSNKNGVRDELEFWIDENSNDINEYRLLKKYAFYHQKYLKDALSVERSKESLTVIKTLINCFYFLSYKKNVRHDEKFYVKRRILEEKIYNNFWRRAMRSVANISADSDWATLSSVKNVLDYPKFCDFKIKNLKEIIKIRAEEDKRWNDIAFSQLMEIIDKYEDK